MGEQIASAAGVLDGLEAFELEGNRVVEFVFSRDGMSATLHIPVNPDTRCVMASDGSVTGELPDGSRWAVVGL
ncbi:MAG TPA: hypothetical protein VF125_08750 [Solirubrobacterales bacterium]